MFDQINGLPVHVLVVHAAVVFVPLLALGAIAYALMNRWRSKIGWAVALLAVAAPGAALFAMLSGNAFFDRLLAEKRVSGEGQVIISDHMNYGRLTFFLALGLGIVTLILVLLTRKEPHRLAKPTDLGLGVVMILLSLASGYYVYKTGDSGAFAVHGSY